MSTCVGKRAPDRFTPIELTITLDSLRDAELFGALFNTTKISGMFNGKDAYDSTLAMDIRGALAHFGVSNHSQHTFISRTLFGDNKSL